MTRNTFETNAAGAAPMPGGGSALSRRRFLAGVAGLGTLAVSGCVSTQQATVPAASAPVKKAPPPVVDSNALAMYGPLPNEKFPIAAIDLTKVPSRYYRRQVDYVTEEPVGTLVVDTDNFYLYLVQPDGKAMRYGVGLGRAGFTWAGRGRIGWKQEWPKWTPPDEMIARQPNLAQWGADRGGMPPGLENPLGARALYVFQGKVDTLYRVHGTPEYWTIGKAVSSGCVRLMNQDIIDLYERVPSQSPILVLGDPTQPHSHEVAGGSTSQAAG